tara:strand:+ start:55 stop:615 length:561 start_codon:yes stop_codon:yes gene_type:complete
MAKKKKGSGGSLRDQLQAAGLVTSKQVRKAENAALRQEVRQKKGADVEVDEIKLAAQQASEAKRAADRARNAERNRIAEDKAIAAQVRQLITTNSQRQAGDVAYNFTDDKRVKTVHISDDNRKQLNNGFLAIVKLDDRYDLVPEKVARKIMERRDNVVLYLYERDADAVDEDDPYKDFPIPDDLDW